MLREGEALLSSLSMASSCVCEFVLPNVQLLQLITDVPYQKCLGVLSFNDPVLPCQI